MKGLRLLGVVLLLFVATPSYSVDDVRDSAMNQTEITGRMGEFEFAVSTPGLDSSDIKDNLADRARESRGIEVAGHEVETGVKTAEPTNLEGYLRDCVSIC